MDGDGDGKIDLFDPQDAILSVAHYRLQRDANPLDLLLVGDLSYRTRDIRSVECRSTTT